MCGATDGSETYKRTRRHLTAEAKNDRSKRSAVGAVVTTDDVLTRRRALLCRSLLIVPVGLERVDGCGGENVLAEDDRKLAMGLCFPQEPR